MFCRQSAASARFALDEDERVRFAPQPRSSDRRRRSRRRGRTTVSGLRRGAARRAAPRRCRRDGRAAAGGGARGRRAALSSRALVAASGMPQLGPEPRLVDQPARLRRVVLRHQQAARKGADHAFERADVRCRRREPGSWRPRSSDCTKPSRTRSLVRTISTIGAEATSLPAAARFPLRQACALRRDGCMPRCKASSYRR